MSRAVEAEEHWRKKAEIPTHAAQATEYITRIGELRRALMFRPGHDFEWLLEWDVTTHTRAPDGQARYLAEIIAREMRRAGHQMVSDGAGSPLVKAICAALPHFGMTGTLTAISMDLRENRPASGWGAESS